MMTNANTLTGSSLLAFNPQSLWRKTFAPHISQAIGERGRDDRAETRVETFTPPKNNRLTHNQALYFSEPDDVRKCLEHLQPDQTFCLILANRL